jgi:hypothetical protein
LQPGAAELVEFQSHAAWEADVGVVPSPLRDQSCSVVA